MDINWEHEIALRDDEGLVTPERKQYAVERALDTVDLIRLQYPGAYRQLQKGSRSVINVVCDAVFRLFRDRESGGVDRESDGVYSYHTSWASQSPDIYFPARVKEFLESLDGRRYYFGAIQRRGI